MSWLIPIAVGALYAWGVARVGVRGWPARRSAAFALGLAAVVVALGPVDARTDAHLWAHTLQHSLISLVGAPLLVAGAPVRLALRAQGRGGRRALAELLGRPWVGALVRPPVALALFCGALALAYVPATYDLFLRQPLLHVLDHAVLLWAALALWASVSSVEPLPHRAGMVARLATLVGAMSAMAAVGAVMSSVGRPLYDHYVGVLGVAGALADQSDAGGVMWVGGMAVALPAVLWVAWQALAEEERRQRVRERAGR